MMQTALSELNPDRFATIKGANRVWAIGAIHGAADKLRALHQHLFDRFAEGDRLVYLGNYMGAKGDIIATLNELLRARRRLLAGPPPLNPEDIVFLRGAQEEMWNKLLQLQFAPSPAEIIDWMLDHGMDSTIEAYGTKAHVARNIAREVTMAITHWTNGLRQNMQTHPGHRELLMHLRRAAFTRDEQLLFVHASIDPTRTLDQQADRFWWDNGQFEDIRTPYQNFRKVIRGYDHGCHGLQLNNAYTATIDGGCGRGGSLNAVCFGKDGEILDQITT